MTRARRGKPFAWRALPLALLPTMFLGPAVGQTNLPDPAQGRLIVLRMGCVACHVITDQPGPYGKVGPPLGGLSARVYVAGSLPNTMDNLIAWLMDPPGLRPGTAMPDLGLSQREARNVAAYLRALPPRGRW